ncbi:hypothetical protein D9757_002707 [Collybiopsis confluens]|uniref:Uncharacterized protein n=1 Tax=Collybiopsis confluens TaxID=2823264 RepID=A0A8H5HWZ3_9AGAR|nr:hypothetical protein D9757_002707 [Collybiopsis confluens]
MLFARSLARRPHHARHFTQYANQAFLDLAIALPYAPHWPAYSATIILVTVAARVVVLPAVFWSTRRQLRYERHVLPVLGQLKPVIMHEEAILMQKEGLLADKEKRAKIHAQRCRDILKAKRKELASIHSCSPVTTALIPIVPQVPLFVAMTMMFARLAADPTCPFDSESFLTLTTLNHPDPTFTLPVILGLVTMANVESSQWVLNPEEKAALKESEKQMAANVEKSGDKWTKAKLNLRSKLKDSMRILSILRIGLASIAPE